VGQSLRTKATTTPQPQVVDSNCGVIWTSGTDYSGGAKLGGQVAQLPRQSPPPPPPRVLVLLQRPRPPPLPAALVAGQQAVQTPPLAALLPHTSSPPPATTPPPPPPSAEAPKSPKPRPPRPPHPPPKPPKLRNKPQRPPPALKAGGSSGGGGMVVPALDCAAAKVRLGPSVLCGGKSACGLDAQCKCCRGACTRMNQWIWHCE
jgi:hypothetical protein